MNINKYALLLTMSLVIFSCSTTTSSTSINASSINNLDELSEQELLRKGTTSLREKNYDQAITSFQKVLTKDKSNTDAIVNLANAYNQKNDKDKAEEYYKKALEVDSSYFYANLYYGDFLIKYKRLKESQPYLIKAVEVNNRNATAYNNLGLTYLSTKDYDKAEEN